MQNSPQSINNTTTTCAANPQITEANQFVESKCALKTCNRVHCRIPWHRPCRFSKGLVNRLRPMLLLIGVVEIGVGAVLLAMMVLLAQEYDEIYPAGYNRAISSCTFGVLVTLTISGLLLLISLFLKRRRLMLVYILLSTILCLFVFLLAVFMIHFGILDLRKDAYKGTGNEKNILLNTGCVLGMLTLFGSVVHFIGNAVVLSYYNFKFIQPKVFSNEMS